MFAYFGCLFILAYNCVLSPYFDIYLHIFMHIFAHIYILFCIEIHIRAFICIFLVHIKQNIPKLAQICYNMQIYLKICKICKKKKQYMLKNKYSIWLALFLAISATLQQAHQQMICINILLLVNAFGSAQLGRQLGRLTQAAPQQARRWQGGL